MKTCFVQEIVVLSYLPKPLAEYLLRKVTSRWMYKYITYEVNEPCTSVILRKTLFDGDVTADIERDLKRMGKDLKDTFFETKELSHMLSEVYGLYPKEKPKSFLDRLLRR